MHLHTYTLCARMPQLQAQLPRALSLVQVSKGMAVLRCEGLFEARVSLQQRPYPPQWDTAKQKLEEAKATAAAAAAASGSGAGTAEGGEGKAAATPAAGAAPSTAGGQEQQQAGAGPSGGPDTPTVRWQWVLVDAVTLPGAAHRAPLREPQLLQLLTLLRQLMGATADAAAVETLRREAAAVMQQAAGGTCADGGAGGPKVSGGGLSPGSLQLPSASARSSGGGAGMSIDMSSLGISSIEGPSDSVLLPSLGEDPSHGLGLEELRADEVAAPLRALHGVLRDVAAQVLLDSVRASAEALAAPGGRWHGHLALSRAQVLSPGVRLHYWAHTPVVLPGAAGRPGAAVAAAAGGGGAGGGGKSKEAADAAALPALEIGISGDGTVQVLHLPPLRVPGTGAALPLRLDAHSADVEDLLLRAAALTGNAQLQLLQLRLSSLLAAHGMAHVTLLRLRPVPHGGGGDAAWRAAVRHGQAADAAGALAFARHELEVEVEGASLLRVLYQPWSGRLLLRPGDAAGGDDNLDAVMQEVRGWRG